MSLIDGVSACLTLILYIPAKLSLKLIHLSVYIAFQRIVLNVRVNFFRFVASARCVHLTFVCYNTVAACAMYTWFFFWYVIIIVILFFYFVPRVIRCIIFLTYTWVYFIKYASDGACNKKHVIELDHFSSLNN